MTTYILDNDVTKIPRLMSVNSQVSVIESCRRIAPILFRRIDNWTPTLQTIPDVSMWEGYELSFLTYYSVFSESIGKIAHRGRLNGLMNLYLTCEEEVESLKHDAFGDPARPQRGYVKFSMENPILRASANMIFSHWVGFVRENPRLAIDHPEITDFSIPLLYEWDA